MGRGVHACFSARPLTFRLVNSVLRGCLHRQLDDVSKQVSRLSIACGLHSAPAAADAPPAKDSAPSPPQVSGDALHLRPCCILCHLILQLALNCCTLTRSAAHQEGKGVEYWCGRGQVGGRQEAVPLRLGAGLRGEALLCNASGVQCTPQQACLDKTPGSTPPLLACRCCGGTPDCVVRGTMENFSSQPLPLQACCERYHDGELEPTAEAVMRARFSAYVKGDADYIVATTHPDNPATEGSKRNGQVVTTLRQDAQATSNKVGCPCRAQSGPHVKETMLFTATASACPTCQC